MQQLQTGEFVHERSERRSRVRNTQLQDFLVAAAVAVLMAAGTQVVIGSFIGFDDANITMNYAENIAGGHGYVYFIGGERVEGSTSPLWTAINVIPFLIGVPVEAWLAGVGLLISALTIVATFRLSRLAARAVGAPEVNERWPVALLYLGLPSFFGWSTWSYMDIGLWVYLNTLIVLAIAESMASERWNKGRLVLIAVLIATCRPEGVAFIGVYAAFAGLHLLITGRRDLLGIPAIFFAAAVLTCAILTALRLFYFGYPAPNTFYAKVSTNFADQLGLGLRYTMAYLGDATTILKFGLAAVLVWLAARNSTGAKAFSTVVLPWVIAAFAISIYTLLGGDHFGSYRFYQFLNPMLVASCAGLALWSLHQERIRRATVVVAILAFVVFAWQDFVRTKGSFSGSIAIAHHSREVGRVIEAWTEKPSIAVIPAGGVSMTYSGRIFDLMGLNWVDMAMAGRSAVTEYKNHGGFDRAVFFETLPDIVDPHFGTCSEAALRSAPITKAMLDDLFNDMEFLSLYEFSCRDGLVFYERR